MSSQLSPEGSVNYARATVRALRALRGPALATRDGYAHLYLLAATDALRHAK